jgi:hypothetical protein
MLTFSQAVTRTADLLGFSSTTDSQDLINIQQDINQGLRLFKNASRRYWTRKEVSTELVEMQQYYTFPMDAVRVTEVRANSNGLDFPILQVDSEAMFNRINIIPAMTINLPMYYWIRGRNEIGLWPIPSETTSAGLIISYEPRLADMSVADTTTTTVTVTNNSVSVTAPSTNFVSTMVGMWFSVTDGTDGNWYQIVAQTASTLTLENYYQGTTSAVPGATPCIIASAPDIPEDYHLGLMYYAAYNFYMKRNELASATLYKGLFDDLLQQYKETYAAKTTGQVQATLDDYRYSLFTLPPNPIS